MIHLPSLLAFLRTVCHPCRAADTRVDRMVAAALDDDLTALARATGVYVDDHGYRAAAIQAEADADPTYRRLREEWDRIDAAVADWAAEVAAIADAEYRELCEGER